MTSMTVYLVPHSTLRGRQLPRSDTLFGALCWGVRLLFSKQRLDDLLNSFTSKTVPFLISSMYEYVSENGRITHYFPKPLVEPYVPDTFEHTTPTPQALIALKKLKALRVISEEIFTDILNGKTCERDFYQAFLNNAQQKSFKLLQESRSLSFPHSAINRLTETVDEHLFFYTEERTFRLTQAGRHQGVFFCLKCQDNFVQDLKTVMYFLADKGIGGGISVGKGHFTSLDILDGLPYDEPPDAESSHVITLSLTSPDPELKKQLSRSWYTLERRQGKIESMYATPSFGHVWKDSVLMLAEGSTFPRSKQYYYGANPIVKRTGNGVDFDIYQYGYAFTVNTQHIEAS